ncbi:ABC transporter-like protein [Melioribacter roseus P3M-2]|uniref:ABC transporter-like protein n=1 Tax=Melioribacter roseus (strain DSM 23840 / JCM 17771 / VKM B-2668 / P3M-2) TaxID=1191523 RepID=I6Z9K1_MELRP|nr:ATP-binding cassette domain-containing protein [Melioribacter roseus]AFN75825.1 ABC transporter-like protein [Melioribacter roseus P3M-2]
MIELINLGKTYIDEQGFRKVLFKGLNCEFKADKITSILAPVGAGKSSLLKILCGLEEPTEGEIRYELPAPLIYIPSAPSSYPWLNVQENILFGLNKYDKEELQNAIKLTGLVGYETHVPYNNSLGFRFRISIARALIRKSGFLLIDEPFIKMDYRSKAELYFLLRKLNKELNLGMLITTSNINEAIFLSDVLFLMKKSPGEIIRKIDVAITKEENLDTFKSEEFAELRKNVINEFKKLDAENLLANMLV